MQSSFLRGCSCCRCSADTDIKDKSEVFVCTSCHVISLSAMRICQRRLSNTHAHTHVHPQTHHVIFFTQELFSATSFLPHSLFLQTNLNLLNKEIKVYEYSFLSEVSPIYLFIYLCVYCFWNIWLVQLIGYKGVINVIQPGGGSLLGREGNRPPPGSRTATAKKRQINPPQPPSNGK